LTDSSKRAIPYPWIIVAILWFSHTVYFLNYMTIGTLAPFIQPELRLSSAQVGILSSAMTIGTILIQIPAGFLCDLFGTKWVMGLGLLFTGGAAILMAWAETYSSAFLFLVLGGIGIGCNQAPGSKAIIMWFSSKGRATAMGIKQTGINMGGVLASVLLPAVALRFGNWRFSFRAAGLAAILSALSIILFFRDPPRQSEPADFPPCSRKKEFRDLILDRDFLLICLYGLLLMVVQYSFATYFLLYATRVLRLDIKWSGILLALAFGVGAFGRIGWGLMSDYLFGGRRRPVFILIGTICGVALAVFVLLKTYPVTALIVPCVTLFGLTGMGWNAVYLTLVGEFPEKRLAGISTGVAFVITNIGTVLGPPFFGHLVDLTGGYALSWIFLALCMVMVAVLSRFQRRDRMNAKATE
jgi:MFS transporter, ACS family, hexuronate transporter